MKYGLEKYKFFIAEKGGKPYQVIATSTYAGKIVRGVAKCDPRDKFNLEFGKELAAARCALKIAEKRKARATTEYRKAAAAADEAVMRFNEMKQYFIDSVDQLDDSIEEIKKLVGVIE
jgi:hypothetical protein